jgi:hypothetical protein
MLSCCVKIVSLDFSSVLIIQFQNSLRGFGTGLLAQRFLLGFQRTASPLRIL